MYSLIDIGLILLFALSLTAAYFIYEKIMSFHQLSFLRNIKNIADAIDGITFGLFTLFFKFLLVYINNDFNVPLFVIIAIVMLLVKNLNISLISMSIPLIYYSISNEHPNITYLLIGTVASIILVYLFVDYFIDNFWSKISVIISISFLSFISLFVFSHGLEFGYKRLVIESSILVGLSVALVYFPLRTAIRFSISANILFESANFVFSNYVRHTFSQEAIGNNIKTNNVHKAIYGIFEIRIKDKISNDSRTEIVETVLSKLETFIPEKGTFFSYDENRFGFFMPIEGGVNIKEINLGILDSNNYFKNINQIFKNLNKLYKTLKGEIINVEVKAGTTIYGVQDSSIKRLEKCSLFALNNVNWNNNKIFIKNFDKIDYRNRLSDSEKLLLMDENINLNNFSNIFIPLLNKEGNPISSNFVFVENNSEYEIIQTVDELVRINGWKDVFDRYFSVEAINKSSRTNISLYIEYSLFILQNDFDIKEFEERLNKLKITSNKVTWLLSLKDIALNNKFGYIKKMVERGHNFAIKDANKITDNQINSMGITKIVVDNNFKNKLKTKVTIINPFIETEKEMENAIRNNIDLYGGILFEENQIAKKANKQSKIYIQDIKLRMEKR